MEIVSRTLDILSDLPFLGKFTTNYTRMRTICSRGLWYFPGSHWLAWKVHFLLPHQPEADGLFLPQFSWKDAAAKALGLRDQCTQFQDWALLIFIFTFYLAHYSQAHITMYYGLKFLVASPRFPNYFQSELVEIQIHLDKRTNKYHFSVKLLYLNLKLLLQHFLSSFSAVFHFPLQYLLISNRL